MKNEHTLLIWESLPEEGVLYFIPNAVLKTSDRKFLKKAHGHHFNGDSEGVEEELEYINNAICEKIQYCSEKSKKAGTAMMWSKYKCDGEKPLEDVQVTHVYRCGFIQ